MAYTVFIPLFLVNTVFSKIIFYPILIFFSVAVTANTGGISLPILFPAEHGSQAVLNSHLTCQFGQIQLVITGTQVTCFMSPYHSASPKQDASKGLHLKVSFFFPIFTLHSQFL